MLEHVDIRVVNGRLRGARFRLAQLTAACPPPPALLEAMRLLGTEAPWLSLSGAAKALHVAELSEGEAGARCVVALAELWGLDADEHALRSGAERRHELDTVRATVRAVGAVRPQQPLGWSDELWLADLGVALDDGHLVARDDANSAVSRAVRRQLAAVGPLSPAELFVGLLRSAVLREGPLRTRAEAAGLTVGAISAWAANQGDIEVVVSTRAVLLRLTSPRARWLRASDPCVLALLEQSDVVTRRDVVAALTAHGHGAGSASVWLVRCPWLRPVGARGQHRPATATSDEAAVLKVLLLRDWPHPQGAELPT